MGKKINSAKKEFDNDKSYFITEAIEIVKKVSFENFNPSIEVSFNLNLNVKKVEQQLRGSVVLPHGNGKVSKVLVVGEKDDVEIAKKAGADYASDETILEEIVKKNWFDFDFIVTTPKLMPKFVKYGKILGPKGLMPNPKLGTVTTNIEKAIQNIKKGQIEYRTNAQGIINLSIGKKTFETKDLVENYLFILNVIKSKRPSTLKGELIKSIHISSTMGPGVSINKDGGAL